MFPSQFEGVIRKVFRLLYHILAHIFCAHYRDLHMLGLVGHANSLTLHFMTFSDTHRLLDDRDCDALNDLYARLKAALAANVAVATDGSPVRSASNHHVTSATS